MKATVLGIAAATAAEVNAHPKNADVGKKTLWRAPNILMEQVRQSVVQDRRHVEEEDGMDVALFVTAACLLFFPVQADAAALKIGEKVTLIEWGNAVVEAIEKNDKVSLGVPKLCTIQHMDRQRPIPHSLSPLSVFVLSLCVTRTFSVILPHAYTHTHIHMLACTQTDTLMSPTHTLSCSVPLSHAHKLAYTHNTCSVASPDLLPPP